MTISTRLIIAGALATLLTACTSADDDSSSGSTPDPQNDPTSELPTGSTDGEVDGGAGEGQPDAPTLTPTTDLPEGTPDPIVPTVDPNPEPMQPVNPRPDPDPTPVDETDPGTGPEPEPTPDPGTGPEPEPTPDPGTGPAPEPTPEPPPGTTTDDGAALDQYTRTRTEQLSLGGPSRTDGSRADGTPSAPSGLVALLTADNWVEMGWVPSSDDGSIVAYEVYRDGQLVGTIDNNEEINSREERRDWRTTTYIDCNYTKNIVCQTVGQPSAGVAHSYTVVAIDNDGNSSAPSAAATFTMNMIEGSAAPDPASDASYTMTFEDDFTGTSLDREKWRTLMPWGPETIVNGEKQYFVDTFSPEGAALGYNPFVLNEGNLEITGIRTPADLLEAANNQPYLSGVITTRDKFDVTYGYVEMRAQVPGGGGLLSTFYLLQPGGGNQYEIDILEYDGREPDGATQNYHYRDGFRFEDTGFRGLAHASPTMILDAGIDLSASFHTYSVLWEPELVIWYIDGIEVRRMTGPRVSDKPMNIVAQQVIGSNWIGDPTGVEFPVKYLIDFMRVWEKQ